MNWDETRAKAEAEINREWDWLSRIVRANPKRTILFFVVLQGVSIWMMRG